MKFSNFSFILISLLFIISSKEYIENINVECVEKTFLPNEENVKITGRFLQKDDITWLIQSGSSIEFYITAYSAEIYFVGDSSINQIPSLRPRFVIYINDKLYFDYTVNELKFIVQLFSGETEEKTKIKVKLLSENVYGGIGIKNINTCSSNIDKKVIEPLAKKNLKIEFIGDSITCAYGVEGKNEFENFKTTTENSSKSYAYLTGEILEADYSVVCYSGHGIISGYSYDGSKNSNDLVKDYYKQNGKNPNYPGDWDFNNHKNDIVFINLGSNDENYVNANPIERNEEFINGYINFLQMIRDTNPDSIIICTLRTTDETIDLVEQAVNRFKDERVFFIRSPPKDINDGYGSNYHPSAIAQKKISQSVSEQISQIYNNVNNLKY